MRGVIDGFTMVRRTTGDILNPTQYRTILEMVRGIISKYNLTQINASYVAFLDHIVNYNDPHEVTQGGYSAEILDRLYATYTNMTTSPLSRDDFDTEIVPTLSMLELIRRVALNQILYDSVKNADGSVDQATTVTLGKDWGFAIPRQVTLTLPYAAVDEAAFVAFGRAGTATPAGIIASANDLTPVVPERVCVFHTSLTSPYFAIDTDHAPYAIALDIASNDLTIELETRGAPLLRTEVLRFTGVGNTLSIYRGTSGVVEVVYNNQTVLSVTADDTGVCSFSITRAGVVTIDTPTGPVSQTLSPIPIPVFSALQIGIDLWEIGSTAFSLAEATIYRDGSATTKLPAIIPVIVRFPPSGVFPVIGSATGTGASSVLVASGGYDLYLTVSGTWEGSVTADRSVDNGTTWTTITPAISGNCDESVDAIAQDGIMYRVSYAITSGTASYRLGQ